MIESICEANRRVPVPWMIPVYCVLLHMFSGFRKVEVLVAIVLDPAQVVVSSVWIFLRQELGCLVPFLCLVLLAVITVSQYDSPCLITSPIKLRCKCYDMEVSSSGPPSFLDRGKVKVLVLEFPSANSKQQASCRFHTLNDPVWPSNSQSVVSWGCNYNPTGAHCRAELFLLGTNYKATT
mmetsp:Transcript_51745/g.77218  ORF Transcript_51745/g.77218 Transcript_51745/m.77218 type:complete len:180 (-) Transcript_51745:223-762(-)